MCRRLSESQLHLLAWKRERLMDIINRTQQSWCTGRHIGYDVSDEVYAATRTNFKPTRGGTANSLTRAMILHPIACGLAFIAFLSTLGGRTIMSSMSGLLITLLDWGLVLCSLAVDFTAFGIIKHEVNSQANGVFPTAKFGSAMWCLVASFILMSGSLLIMAMSFVGAVRQRRAERQRANNMQAANAGARRKKSGIF